MAQTPSTMVDDVRDTRRIDFGRRSRSILEERYVREGTSIRELAGSLGASPSWVYRLMVSVGIPRRRPGRPKNEKKERISRA